MDKLSFLDAPNGVDEQFDTPDTLDTASEPTGPARGPDGKFLAKEPDPAAAEAAPPEPQPEPEPAIAEPPAEPVAPPVEPPPAPNHVPLPVLLEERDKRQAAEERARAAEERARQFEQQQNQAPIPDPTMDPEGFAAHQQQRFQDQLLNERLNNSERFARREHGVETVEAAKAWAKDRMNNPYFRQQILGDPDPYEVLVTEYRRDQVVSAFKSAQDFEAFTAWQAQRNAAPASTPPAAPAYAPAAVPQPPTPPRSLAAQPSAGGAKPGEQPVGGGVAFGQVFRA